MSFVLGVRLFGSFWVRASQKGVEFCVVSPPSVLFFFIAFSFLSHFVLLAIPLLLSVLLSLAALFFGLGKANIMKLLPLSKQFLFIVECLFVQ
jgi:hypothetical protein